MSEQAVFKAIKRFPMDSTHVAFIKGFLSNPASSNYNLWAFVDSKLANKRVELLNSGRAQLEGQERSEHLLNIYLECDKTNYMVIATYVFSDRNTAMLFKLGSN